MTTAPPEPREHYALSTDDGHEVYVEWVGSPTGVPLIYCHGGPGSGCSVNQRKLFDPDLFNACLFDQRGSGRSRPLASDERVDLSTNTTAHLISDMEEIRERAGIERWVVVGLSWGTTLALAYAEAHPERVSGLVLGLVTTTSRSEVDWITRDVGCLFPEPYERFASFVPDSLAHLRTVEAYGEMLTGDDLELAERAAIEWCHWEDAHVSLAPGHQHNPRFDDPEFRLRFARLVTHYWRHDGFLAERPVLEHVARIAAIPGVLIHGRYDVSSPLSTAFHLHRAWPASELVVLGDSGHGDGDDFLPALSSALARIGAEAREERASD